jgi:hypothetical protein
MFSSYLGLLILFLFSIFAIFLFIATFYAIHGRVLQIMDAFFSYLFYRGPTAILFLQAG